MILDLTVEGRPGFRLDSGVERLAISFQGRDFIPGLDVQEWLYQCNSLTLPNIPDLLLKEPWRDVDTLTVTVILENSYIPSWLYVKNQKTDDGWTMHCTQYQSGRLHKAVSAADLTPVDTLDLAPVGEWELRFHLLKEKGVSVELNANGSAWTEVPTEVWADYRFLTVFLDFFHFLYGKNMGDIGKALSIEDVILKHPILRRWFDDRDILLLLKNQLIHPDKKKVEDVLGMNRHFFPYLGNLKLCHWTRASINNVALFEPSISDMVRMMGEISAKFTGSQIKLILEAHQELSLSQPLTLNPYLLHGFLEAVKLSVLPGSDNFFEDQLSALKGKIKAVMKRLDADDYRNPAMGNIFQLACYVVKVQTLIPSKDPLDDPSFKG